MANWEFHGDVRDFVNLPHRERNRLWRLTFRFRWGFPEVMPHDGQQAVALLDAWTLDELLQASASHRRARGWFVFSEWVHIPPSSVRLVRRRPRSPGDFELEPPARSTRTE